MNLLLGRARTTAKDTNIKLYVRVTKTYSSPFSVRLIWALIFSFKDWPIHQKYNLTTMWNQVSPVWSELFVFTVQDIAIFEQILLLTLELAVEHLYICNCNSHDHLCSCPMRICFFALSFCKIIQCDLCRITDDLCVTAPKCLYGKTSLYFSSVDINGSFTRVSLSSVVLLCLSQEHYYHSIHLRCSHHVGAA